MTVTAGTTPSTTAIRGTVIGDHTRLYLYLAPDTGDEEPASVFHLTMTGKEAAALHTFLHPAPAAPTAELKA